MVLILHDVTQQRQQDEIKSGAISTVSHQLKTPLTSIRMAIHLLLEEKVGGLSPKQADLLVAAREDADRLDTIVDELLDIGRIESGKARMDLRPVPPIDLVSREMEAYRRAARDGGVSLVVDLPATLPPVWADPTRIAHVFANLLSNALKYTPPGGKVTLSAKAEGEFVRFQVSDTGVGIPEKYLPRIFEQFFRVPDQGPGTGVRVGTGHREGHRGGPRRDRRGGKPGGGGKHVPLYPAEGRPQRHGRETGMIDGIYLGIVIVAVRTVRPVRALPGKDVNPCWISSSASSASC